MIISKIIEDIYESDLTLCKSFDTLSRAHTSVLLLKAPRRSQWTIVMPVHRLTAWLENNDGIS